MLMRNMNPRAGLCNGTRLVITRLGRKVIEGRILTGDHKRALCTCILRIPLSSLSNELPWIVTRHQFPLRPCFAITVKLSKINIQGMGGTVDLGILGVRMPVRLPCYVLPDYVYELSQLATQTGKSLVRS